MYLSVFSSLSESNFGSGLGAATSIFGLGSGLGSGLVFSSDNALLPLFSTGN